MERQRLLEILYENIQDKAKIHTGKRVSSVQNFDTHALVTAADGTQITCDVVAGADGVHSVVRREIEAATPGLELPADCTYIPQPQPHAPNKPSRSHPLQTSQPTTPASTASRTRSPPS